MPLLLPTTNDQRPTTIFYARGPQRLRQSAQDRLPHEGELAAERAQNARALGRDAPLPPHPPGAPRCTGLRAARWASLRERSHPPRHGVQQDAEGLRREIEDDGRLRLA